MTLKTVMFDMYGTLAGFDPPREQIQSAVLTNYGLEVTKEGIDAGYHLADQFMTAQNASQPVRTLNPNEQWTFFARYEQLVLKGAGHDVDLAVAGEIWAHIRKQEYRIALFPDVIAGLDEARTLGLSVGVISNMNTTGERLAQDMGLVGHVDWVVTSGETGSEKPDPYIFEVGLQKASAHPNEAVVVGDQIDSDIAGGLGAGISPVLMDRYNGHPEYKDHPRVTDMQSTLELLKTLIDR